MQWRQEYQYFEDKKKYILCENLGLYIYHVTVMPDNHDFCQQCLV